MSVNGKMRPVEKIPGKRGEDGGGEFKYFKYSIFDLIRNFVNATMYPYPTQ
jgi:hypothetical protein